MERVMADDAEALGAVATRVVAAWQAADLAAISALLDPQVRWGPPGDPSPPCRSREQVLSWYRRGRSFGARATVAQTAVCGDRILLALKVTGRGDAGTGSRPEDHWQVLTVRNGLITEIVGFDDGDEAARWAGLTDAAGGS
jgi:ketosteroid isomerase-like protein